MNESRQTLNREQSSAPVLASVGLGTHPLGDAFVVKTTTIKTYPTVAGSYFACQPLDIGGPEVEGTAYTTTPFGGMILCANIGNAIPPLGTQLWAERTSSRITIAFYS